MQVRGVEMPVGSGSRNGGTRDRDTDLNSQNKANGDEDSSNSDDDSTSCKSSAVVGFI